MGRRDVGEGVLEEHRAAVYQVFVSDFYTDFKREM